MTASHASTKLYLVIGGWLAALMLLGVFISELPILPLSKGVIMLIVVLLSTVKAALVALYYMHLKMDQRLLTLVALAPLAILALAMSVVFSSFFITL
jgi:caa(3)-type oxidase subunit IV